MYSDFPSFEEFHTKRKRERAIAAASANNTSEMEMVIQQEQVPGESSMNKDSGTKHTDATDTEISETDRDIDESTMNIQDADTLPSSSILQHVSNKVETWMNTNNIPLITIIILYSDLIASCILLTLDLYSNASSKAEETTSPSPPPDHHLFRIFCHKRFFKMIHGLLNSWSSICLLYYVLEILGILIIGRTNKKKPIHMGYIMDTFLVSSLLLGEFLLAILIIPTTQAQKETTTISSSSNAFNNQELLVPFLNHPETFLLLFRIATISTYRFTWRLLQYIYLEYIQKSFSQKNAMKEKLEQNYDSLEKLELDLKIEKERYHCEIRSKALIEKAMKEYKEEVDTLTEALKIAALDLSIMSNFSEGRREEEKEIAITPEGSAKKDDDVVPIVIDEDGDVFF
eukprot:CAMPEP_0178940610 /NCGR_PEP_ID=MMETSP0789-20121207/910_1 /TAXON_ID=3005 /ORGANISM="Rhizosolenia setigera, Strain CCMP 1694" /LENGTH=399 /DNA_ID=CAMNT_0020619679 /DNA_START=370 /DNA_END=1569 /DNA_ORIENTATION=+